MPPTKKTQEAKFVLWTRATFLRPRVAAALVNLKPGALRELHWQSQCSEWQFWLAGKGRMTIS